MAYTEQNRKLNCAIHTQTLVLHCLNRTIIFYDYCVSSKLQFTLLHITTTLTSAGNKMSYLAITG